MKGRWLSLLRYTRVTTYIQNLSLKDFVMDTFASIAVLALAFAAPVALAQTTPTPSQIDPNTFIVGHPASPTWKRVQPNGSHPAVLVAARAAANAPDSNTFLVQPPASVRWTASPQTLVVAGAQR